MSRRLVLAAAVASLILPGDALGQRKPRPKPRLLGVAIDSLAKVDSARVAERPRPRLLGVPADTTPATTLLLPSARSDTAVPASGPRLLGTAAPRLSGTPAPASPDVAASAGESGAAPVVTPAAASRAPAEPAGPRLLGTPAPPMVADATYVARPAALLLGAEPRARDPDFLERQLAHARVADARDAAESKLRLLFRRRGIDYPAYEVFLQVFKQEQAIEVWARNGPEDRFTLLTSYAICALSGRLGPKRRQGDMQVPEGFYFIEAFNPESRFHLSLRLNYPNPADTRRGEEDRLGGDIFIHGGCRTEGCLPIEDDKIQELYWLAAQTRAAGQRAIPVHIFPTRMNAEGLEWLRSSFQPDRRLLEFWQTLRDGYDAFEKTRRSPLVAMDDGGRYRVVPLAPPRGGPVGGGPVGPEPGID